MSVDYPHLAEMVAHVQAKAARDPAFRSAFLANPKGVVELEFGITLPEQAGVQAVEAPNDTVVVVLPPALAPTDGGLSDDDLESIAGGKGNPVKALTSLALTTPGNSSLCR